jgi:nucleoside permease NupC
MDHKSRAVLAVLMSGAMSFMVTLLATYINLGMPPDYLTRWLKAWAIAWPIAAVTAYLVMPLTQRMTKYLVSPKDGPR